MTRKYLGVRRAGETLHEVAVFAYANIFANQSIDEIFAN
jgi:hypothetical protein